MVSAYDAAWVVPLIAALCFTTTSRLEIADVEEARTVEVVLSSPTVLLLKF